MSRRVIEQTTALARIEHYDSLPEQCDAQWKIIQALFKHMPELLDVIPADAKASYENWLKVKAISKTKKRMHTKDKKRKLPPMR